MSIPVEVSTPPASADQVKIEKQAVARPTKPTSGAVVEDRPDDRRVGKLEQIQKAADEAFAGTDVKLSISYDEDTGRFIYRGLDPETGEVVREYPPEELLDTMTRLRQMVGVALDRKS